MTNYQEYGRWFSGENVLDGRGESTKCNYNTSGFIVLKEVSPLHFGRNQHKGRK